MEEIEKSFQNLAAYYIKEGENLDQSMKIFFDDLKLAYTTLINQTSRTEYDEYLTQNQAMAGYQRRHAGVDDEDPEAKAERERRQRERGKKRWEEDHSFVNDEFFQSWKNRTGASDPSGEQQDNYMVGKNVQSSVSITFDESL